MRLNADTGIDRKPAVLVGQHVFGVTTLKQAPAHEGAQDAPSHVSLHLGCDSPINPTDRVKTKFRRAKNDTRR